MTAKPKVMSLPGGVDRQGVDSYAWLAAEILGQAKKDLSDLDKLNAGGYMGKTRQHYLRRFFPARAYLLNRNNPAYVYLDNTVSSMNIVDRYTESIEKGNY